MDTEKYGLPIKIEDDGLQDTLVQIGFDTIYSQKKIDNDLYNCLQSYQNEYSSPFIKMSNKMKTTGIEPNLQDQYYYSNGLYKVKVKPNQVVFNCMVDYPGWEEYTRFITMCISGIQNDIQRYTRVSVRYISCFPEISIFNFLDGNIHLACLPNLDGGIYSVRYGVSEGAEEKGVVVAKIYDRVIEQGVTQSIIDITVKSQQLSSSQDELNTGEMTQYLSFCHHVEKDVFFRLLCKDFIDSKNPIYPNNKNV